MASCRLGYYSLYCTFIIYNNSNKIKVRHGDYVFFDYVLEELGAYQKEAHSVMNFSKCNKIFDILS